MSTQWIEIELTADVIISRNAATEGGHSCLDYIPGSALYGTLLGGLPKNSYSAPDLLAGNKLICGNAYPCHENSRSTPVPFSYHRAKTEDDALIDGLAFGRKTSADPSTCKQMRSGFVTLSAQATLVNSRKDYRMKTARDRNKFGSAKENALFGFESLSARQIFLAPVTAEDALLDASLPAKGETCRVRIGRSRSAEYSTALLRRIEAPEALPPSPQTEGKLIVYCHSDLCLTDPHGQPTLDPQAGLTGEKQLLGGGAQYRPEQSFLRTRFYWPWNHFYNSPDRGRSVIEAGSVLVFEGASVPGESIQHIGLFRSEGLGEIWLNPDFVVKPAQTLNKPSENDSKESVQAEPPDAPIIQLLQNRTQAAELEHKAIAEGKTWSKRWHRELNQLRQQGAPLPGRSQWSYLRALAGRPGASLNTSELQSYFYDSTRRKFWGSKGVGIGNVILKALGHEKESVEVPALKKRALYHASIDIYRALNTSGKDSPS